MTSAIIDDNLHGIRQALELLDTLDDARLRNPEPACFHSSIGGHLRHNADHYLALIAGWPERKIDYDARQRDVRMETATTVAKAAFTRISAELSELREASLDSALQIRVDTGPGEPTWTLTSLGRELQFLLSHCIHHYALIATICRLCEHPLPVDFGIAPSTLRHRAKLAVG